LSFAGLTKVRCTRLLQTTPEHLFKILRDVRVAVTPKTQIDPPVLHDHDQQRQRRSQAGPRRRQTA